jgi:hypothetical protein
MKYSLGFICIYLFLVKICVGQKLFQQTYLPQGHTCNGPLIGTSIGNDYLILASTTNISQLGHSPLLFKVKAATGEVVWAKSYLADFSLYVFDIFSITTLANEAILISGIYRPNISLGIRQPFIMLTDIDGNIIWCKVFAGVTISTNVKAVFLDDKSIVVGYSTHVYPFDVVLQRVSFNGSVVWKKTLGSRGTVDFNDTFKDIAKMNNGDFAVLIENDYGDNLVKSGICLFRPNGDIRKSLNISSVNKMEMVPSSLAVTQDNDLLICVRQNLKVATIRVHNMDTIVFSTEPLIRGFSHNDDFVLSHHTNTTETFLIGEDDITDEGYTGLRIIRYDSSLLATSTFMYEKERVMINGNGGVIISGDDMFCASIVNPRQPDLPLMTLTKISAELSYCKPKMIDTLTGYFVSTAILNYEVESKNQTASMSDTHLLAQQTILDTVKECEVNYFNCRKSLGIDRHKIVCNENNYTIMVPHYPLYTYLWSTSDTTNSITVDSSGRYFLTLFPPSGFGCDTLYDSISVLFIHTPSPEITHVDTLLWPNTPFNIQVQHPSDYDSLAWTLTHTIISKEQRLNYAFDKNGRYTIYVTAFKQSCPVTDSISFLVNGYSFFMPNSFTPDFNGINDVFEPRGAGVLSYELDIYSAWGGFMFKGRNKGWNGMNGNLFAATGVYFYEVKYVTEKGEEFYKRGTVTLIR